VRLVHKLEQLVDDRLEELPVSLEEPRVLADDVHDVRRDDGLVVFPSLNFAETEEILDNLDEESLLGFLVYE
jgi:hypothetical protein